MLPQVKDNAASFAMAHKSIFGAEIPISAMIGDQPSALVGQACFEPGMVKSTYGTGCFVLINTGDQPIKSNNKLLTTLAFQVNSKTCYALEGSIFVAGAAVQWLRDGLQIIESADQSDSLAMQADLSQDVYLVPAFVGLGAPYWDPDCRGALYGITRGTGPAEITKATLESVCYQTSDLLNAISKDLGDHKLSAIRVDGGMAASNWTMQTLSDLLQLPVDRPKNLKQQHLGLLIWRVCKSVFTQPWKILLNPGDLRVSLILRCQTTKEIKNSLDGRMLSSELCLIVNFPES